MKNRIHKFQVSVTINGRKYVTAKAAANEWADTVEYRMYQRHTDKIGQSAYYDPAWSARNIRDPNAPTNTLNYNGIAVEMYTGQNKLKEKAYRRCIKIFQTVLK